MDYDFRKIEKKWQAYWAENGTFKTKEDPSRPKFYVLDMFPYPSGAGNTFSSLIHSFFASRFLAPARNILESILASMVCLSTTSFLL